MPLLGKLFDARAYDSAFAIAACCPVLGYACFRGLGAVRPPAVAPSAG
jgi:hypothetical protein